MIEQPKIKPGDWIYVGQIHCVVANVYEPDNTSGNIEVVFNPDKPTNRDVNWNGNEWEFSPSSDFGGYADQYPRLNYYVRILKRQ